MVCLSGFELYSRWVPLNTDSDMVFSSIQEAIGFEIQHRDIPNGRPKTGSASLEGISHDS